jgi:hypothetical protein
LSNDIRVFSRHPRGNGKIGRYVTIQSTVLVDDHSIVEDQCELYGDSKVMDDSHLCGFSRMTGSASVTRCRLDHLVQMHDRSDAMFSRLQGDITLTGGTTIDGCNLRTATGQQIRLVNAGLQKVTAFGSVWVSNANVYNCELLPGTRLYSGEWDRAPRVVRSGGQYDLTEAEDDQVTIGCMTKPIAVWRKLSPDLWKSIGYSDEELDEIASLICAW